MNASNRIDRGAVLGAIALLLFVATGASVATAGSAPALRHDPFRASPVEGPVAGSPTRGPGPVANFVPVLRSTIVGDSRAMANLGGEVLAIGEEAHGYRLLAVGLYDAVFEKDGRRIQLEVHSERDPSP